MTNDIAKPNKTLFRVLLAAFAVLLLCSVFCGAAAANETVTDIYDEAALREAVTQPDFNVRLCADIRLTDYYKTGRDNSLVIPPAVTKGTIDLNGHTLLYAGFHSTGRGDNNGSVIIIKAGELTVNDNSSEKTGKITGGMGTHTLMTYGQNYLFGGGVYVADGARLILNDGSISDNRIDDGGMIDAAGAGVYADEYGEVIMNGGSITNNYASAHNGYGAGVHIRRGSFTMTGGTISGNIASSSNSVGGGVYLWGNVKFIMTGGVISGNSANRGGGVYVNSGATFYVGKSVSIMDNSRDDVALIDGHFRTIPKGMLHLTEDLNGYVLVAPEDRYRGPSFGTASSGLSPQTERGIINEKNWKYATVVNGNLEWGDKISTNTLITLVWDDKDKFYEDKIGHVVIPQGGRWIHITPISKPGHSFTGWYLQEQGGTTPLIDVNGYLTPGVESYTNAAGEWIYTGETLKLYAGWNQDGTTLTLDGKGGTPTSQTVKVEEGSTTVTYTPPTRTDSGSQITYTFCGWFLPETTIPLIDVNGNLAKGMSPYTDDAGKWIYDKTTLTLRAEWYADGTQLTLDGQGGEPATQTVAVQCGATKIDNFSLSVKDGYACTGWYIGETATATSGPIKLINRDGTLVKGVTADGKDYTDASGHWIYNDTKTPTLTLHADWVTDVTYYKGDEKYVELSYQHGQKTDIPAAPTSEGSFIGWRVGENGPFIFFYQGTDYQYLTPSPYYNSDSEHTWKAKAETLNLYAAILGTNGEGQDSISLLTVTYDANGAESGRIPADKEWYAPGDNVPVCRNTGALEKYGYTFDGWNTREDGTGITYAAGSTIENIQENITLYAKWGVKKYTITFDSDGGSYVAPITQAYGTPVTAPANPTSDGYTFQYWIRWGHEEGSEGEWITGVPTTMPGMDITCYALWKVNEERKIVPQDGNEVTFEEAKVYSPTDSKVEVSPVKGLVPSTTVTLRGDTDEPAPDNTIPGFNEPTVLAKFEINIPEGGFTNNTKIVIKAELTGNQKPEHVYLRHFTEDAWDGEHIKSEPEGTWDPETGMYTFTFKPTSFSPFALTYETPVKSSSPQGSSTWLTETSTPTPTPTPTPAVTPAPEVPTVKPIATETPQAKTPVPFAGILAGLGAAGAVLAARMRR